MGAALSAASPPRAGAPLSSGPPAPASSERRNMRLIWTSTVQDAALEGGRDRLRAVVHAQLRQDAADEPFRGATRDAQLGRDLCVGPPLGHEPQHLDLAGGQAGSGPAVGDPAGDFGRDPAQARVHGPDRSYELGRRRALEKIGLGPGLARPVDILVSLLNGQGDEAAAGELRTYRFHDPDPVEDWTAQVHEEAGGPARPARLHR